jgi:hypothetical protein
MRRLFFIERPAHRGPTLALICGRAPMTQKKINNPNVIAASQPFPAWREGQALRLVRKHLPLPKNGLAHD